MIKVSERNLVLNTPLTTYTNNLYPCSIIMHPICEVLEMLWTIWWGHSVYTKITINCFLCTMCTFLDIVTCCETFSIVGFFVKGTRYGWLQSPQKTLYIRSWHLLMNVELQLPVLYANSILVVRSISFLVQDNENRMHKKNLQNSLLLDRIKLKWNKLKFIWATKHQNIIVIHI
jgi:hypothetical protein